MKLHPILALLLSICLTGCYDSGRLTVIADMPLTLKESSALEVVNGTNLFWTIQDAGNRPIVYGLNPDGTIKRTIKITNSENRDWEDLTTDQGGNLYIGDFGNNHRSRPDYRIYKIKNLEQVETEADIIEFSLPDGKKPLDFEGFFLKDNNFYIWSKEKSKFEIYVVPNRIGKHRAKLMSSHQFKGSDNQITSVDISNDGSTIVVLNHSKLHKLSKFTKDDFFSGKIETISFGHASQKEGICFGKNNMVYISDENSGMQGGNIYSLDLDKI